MTIKTLSSKDPEEIIPVKFYFDNVIDAVDFVAGVTISLATGVTDINMSTMLLGASIVSEAMVVQMVQGGIDGNVYKIKCKVLSGAAEYVTAALLPIAAE